MNKLYSLGSAKVRPAAGVASRETPSFQPVATSPWIAMSTMQKAIRRGRERLAVAAAATLLRESPERFWRRAGVIVFEDIGIADLECVSMVTACLAGKKFREKLGEAGVEGKPQLVIPGAEKIGDGELAQRKSHENLKPKVGQKDPDGVALFGDGHKQSDLLDQPAKKP